MDVSLQTETVGNVLRWLCKREFELDLATPEGTKRPNYSGKDLYMLHGRIVGALKRYNPVTGDLSIDIEVVNNDLFIFEEIRKDSKVGL